MHKYLTTAVLVMSSLAASQTPTHISPAAAVGGPSSLGSDDLFGILPSVAYQQVHSLTSFHNTNPAVFTRLRLRMGALWLRTPGKTIDVELYMAWSPRDSGTASEVFRDNVIQGTEVNVFTRKMVRLPVVTDNSWAVAPFVFDVPFPFTGANHVSWRAVVHANPNLASYPLDRWASNLGISPFVGRGCLAASGSHFANHQVVSVLAPGGAGQYFGTPMYSALVPAILATGASNTRFAGVGLPLDLSPFGAPGCSVYNDWLHTAVGVTSPGHPFSGIQFRVVYPEDPSLAGSTHYSQIYFLDPTANALGVFTTNGVSTTLGAGLGITMIVAENQPGATSGVRHPQFGLAIGLD